jgi:Domain of unknown function (DUF4340)
MKRRWLAVLALALAVVLLGTLLHFRPADESKRTYALSALKPGAATAVTFTRGSQPAIVLEKRAGAWHLKAPYAARADELQVARLLNVLEARTPTRFPAADLARFDLAQPVARLTVDGETFAFGAVNAMTREQYVLAGDAVYSVDVKYVSGLPAGVSALVHKRLFNAEDRLVKFEFADFTVAQRDGKWVVTPAPAAEVSQDDVLRWVEHWRQAQALRAEPGEPRPLRGEARITRADGSTVALGIVQREPEMRLFNPADGMVYTFFAAIGNRLMTPPGNRSAGGENDKNINKNK